MSFFLAVPAIAGLRLESPFAAPAGRASKTVQPVYHHHRQPACAHRLGLPMTMTQHAAAVGRVHFYGFSLSRQKERRAREKVSNNGLKMAVRKPWMRIKLREPGRRRFPRLSRHVSLRHRRSSPKRERGTMTILWLFREDFGAASGDRTHDILSHSQALSAEL